MICSAISFVKKQYHVLFVNNEISPGESKTLGNIVLSVISYKAQAVTKFFNANITNPLGIYRKVIGVLCAYFVLLLLRDIIFIISVSYAVYGE